MEMDFSCDIYRLFLLFHLYVLYTTGQIHIHTLPNESSFGNTYYHYYFFLLGTHQTMISIKFNAIRTKLITKVLVFLRSTFNWPCNHWFFFFKFLSWFHLFLWKEFESKMINWSRHWMALKKIWHLCYSFHFNLNFEL